MLRNPKRIISHKLQCRWSEASSFSCLHYLSCLVSSRHQPDSVKLQSLSIDQFICNVPSVQWIYIQRAVRKDQDDFSSCNGWNKKLQATMFAWSSGAKGWFASFFFDKENVVNGMAGEYIKTPVDSLISQIKNIVPQLLIPFDFQATYVLATIDSILLRKLTIRKCPTSPTFLQDISPPSATLVRILPHLLYPPRSHSLKVSTRYIAWSKRALCPGSRIRSWLHWRQGS